MIFRSDNPLILNNLNHITSTGNMASKGERMILQERREKRLKRINELIETGLNLTCICRMLAGEFGVSERVIRSFYQRNRSIVSYSSLPVVVKASKTEIIKIYNQGDTVEEIADLFGFGENHIRTVIKAHEKNKKEELCKV